MKNIFNATLFVALFLFASAGTTTTANAAPANTIEKLLRINFLDVEIKDHTEAIMSWSALPGSGPYSVSVYDETDGTRFASFTTFERKDVIVNGLTEGHDYRFTVRKGITILTVVVTA